MTEPSAAYQERAREAKERAARQRERDDIAAMAATIAAEKAATQAAAQARTERQQPVDTHARTDDPRQPGWQPATSFFDQNRQREWTQP